MSKLSESLLAEFDEKFVEINAINYKDKVLSGRDETTVIRLKQFLSTAITRIEKEARKSEQVKLAKTLKVYTEKVEKEARENLIKEFSESFGAYIKPEDGPVKLLEDSYIMPVKYVDHLISSLTKERKDSDEK